MHLVKRLMFLSAVLVGALVSNAAHAQSCSTMVSNDLAWTATQGHYLDVMGVSLNANQGGNSNGLASYVTGFLDTYTASTWYYDFSHNRFVTVPAKVSGSNNTQAFSDRVVDGSSQNFALSKRDSLGISLDANGTLTITLNTWGGGTITVTPTTCTSDVMYGFASDGTLWAFRFKQAVIPG